jgi:hypothetical protein
LLSPEKNDVIISKLFNWGNKFSIVDSKGTKISDVYIRLVGDSELNRARVFGLRKSAEMRKKLRDPNSDEHMAYILDKDTVEKQNLVNYLLYRKTSEFAQAATKDIDIPFPKELEGDSTLEEQENYQKEVDSYPARVEEKVRSVITKQAEDEQKRLEAMNEDDLYKLFVVTTTNELCETEMYSRFRDFCVFSGSYKDDKYRHLFFNSIEEFSNLPRELKEQFLTNYDTLEISMEELKK